MSLFVVGASIHNALGVLWLNPSMFPLVRSAQIGVT